MPRVDRELPGCGESAGDFRELSHGLNILGEMGRVRRLGRRRLAGCIECGGLAQYWVLGISRE